MVFCICLDKELKPWDIDYALRQHNFASEYALSHLSIDLPNHSLTMHLNSIFIELAELFHLNLVNQSSLTFEPNSAMHYHLNDMHDGKFLGEVKVDLFQE